MNGPSDAAVEAFRDWVDPSEDIGEIEFMQRIRSGLEAAYRVDAPKPEQACGKTGVHGVCVFARSHQSICRNSNGLGIS